MIFLMRAWNNITLNFCLNNFIFIIIITCLLMHIVTQARSEQFSQSRYAVVKVRFETATVQPYRYTIVPQSTPIQNK